MQNQWKANGVVEIKNVLYVPMNMPDIKENFFELPFINTKLFDDFYYVGTRFVGCVLLNTSDGIVMIDSMNHEGDGKKIIEAIREFGLDPQNLKHLIITHGHVDHYGGAKYLKKQTNCKVYMTEIDYNFMLTTLIDTAGIEIAQGVQADPGIDYFLTDGEVIKIGDTELQVYITPGHTPGGISLIFPVHDGCKVHKVGFWGGTAAPPKLDAAEQYFTSLTRFMDLTSTAQTDVSFIAHPFFDYSLAKGMFDGKIAARKPGEPHPLVMGVERYQIFLQALRAFIVGYIEELKEAGNP